MDRRVTSRVNMFNAVKKVCTDKPDTVALIPAFALLVDRLGEFMLAIKALMKKLATNTEGFAEAKGDVRKELSLLLSIVCGAGVSYGKKIKNKVLEKQFDYPESDFVRMKDAELIETADNIIAMQAQYDKELLDYGISPEIVVQLKTARTGFEIKSPEPIVNIYTGEADREELLKKAFETSDFVLNDLLSAAKIYKLKDPNFYMALENASRISKVGVRHPDPEADAVSKALKQAKTEKKKRDAVAKITAQEERKRNEQEELRQLLAEMAAVDGAGPENVGVPNVEVEQPALNGAH